MASFVEPSTSLLPQEELTDEPAMVSDKESPEKLSPAKHDEVTEQEYLMEQTWYNRQQRRRFPWRGIILACLLLTFGLLFIAAGILILVGVLRFQALDKITPYGLIVFGILCVIPGAYHICLAVRISAGYGGLSWDDIPDFN